MHELGLAKDVLRKILDTATQQNLNKVSYCQILVGETKIHHADEFKNLLISCAKGTIADGLAFDLTITPLQARCTKCNTVFSNPPCPNCGNLNPRIISGIEIEIKNLR